MESTPATTTLDASATAPTAAALEKIAALPSVDGWGKGGSRSMIVRPNKCAACAKGVYPLERVQACDKDWHKQCFRCKHCNMVLSLKAFAVINSEPYCKPHYMEIFKTKGNYAGFGDSDAKGGTGYTGGFFTAIGTSSAPSTPQKEDRQPKDQADAPAVEASPAETPAEPKKAEPAKSEPAKEAPPIPSVEVSPAEKPAEPNKAETAKSEPATRSIPLPTPPAAKAAITPSATSSSEPVAAPAASQAPASPSVVRAALESSDSPQSPQITTKAGKCAGCAKSVYPLERVQACDKDWHKQCFRCKHCNAVLSLGGFATINADPYCKPHYMELFKSKGNYSVFSDSDAKGGTSYTGGFFTAISPSTQGSSPAPSRAAEATPAQSGEGDVKPTETPKPETSESEKKAEVDAQRKKQEEEEEKAKKAAEEAARKKAADEAAQKKKQEEEEKAKKAAEEAAQKKAEEAKKASDEAAEKKKAEEAAKKQADQEAEEKKNEEERRKAEERARIKEQLLQPITATAAIPGFGETKSLVSRRAPTNKCAACEKSVYPLERVQACDKDWHKQCFRCKHCNMVLSLKAFAVINSEPYCKPHYMEIFKTKGNYAGFGDSDAKGGSGYTGVGFVGVNVEAQKKAKEDEEKRKQSTPTTSTAEAIEKPSVTITTAAPSTPASASPAPTPSAAATPSVPATPTLSLSAPAPSSAPSSPVGSSLSAKLAASRGPASTPSSPAVSALKEDKPKAATWGESGSKSMIVRPNKCAACDKGVYPLERVQACDKDWHKQCFRCKHCNMVLSLKAFAVINSEPYCKPHYMEIFKSKGNYAGFGDSDAKGGSGYTGLGFTGVNAVMSSPKTDKP